MSEVALSPGKVELTSTDSDLSDVREPVGGLMPGDSYPAVAASLDDIDSDVNTDSEELEAGAGRGGGGGGEPDYLLQKLRKGGTRMEQIKRQLVVQRGAIVAALKILAQSRTGSGSGSLSSYKRWAWDTWDNEQMFSDLFSKRCVYKMHLKLNVNSKHILQRGCG